jgi:predicted exporter/lauroyl/myristoyl acyltransferase
MIRGWAIAVLCGVVLVGFLRLRFDAEPLSLLPQEVASVAGLRLHQEHFAGGRELVVTVRSGSAESSMRAAEAVALGLRGLTNDVRSARWRVSFEEDLAENVAWLWLQQSPEKLRALGERLRPERVAESVAEARERLATSLDPVEIARAGYDPLGLLEVPGLDAAGGGAGAPGGKDGFGNAAGTFRMVMVEPTKPRMSYREATGWLERVKAQVAIAAAAADAAGVQVAYTGGPAFLTEVANGMERDLQTSVASTVLMIGLLFWAAHRSFRPLRLLVTALLGTLVLTLAAGGLVLGTLNVISCGFAAVMMGLVVDYGLVGFQEYRAHPELSLAALRQRVMPGIGWSAVTTAGTFLSLGLAGLPGLAELGVLTAMGLGIGAAVMVGWFLPRVLSGTPANRAETLTGGGATAVPVERSSATAGGLWLTVGVAAVCVGILGFGGLPPIERGAAPLRPRNSAAYAAMEELQREMGQDGRTTWLLFRGTTADAVAEQMDAARPVLEREKQAGRVTAVQWPTAFWPRPAFGTTNASILKPVVAGLPQAIAAVTAGGFNASSVVLAERIGAVWKGWLQQGVVPLWPDTESARWLSGLASSRTSAGGWLGLGTVTSAGAVVRFEGLPEGVLVTGWDRLGPDLVARVGVRVAWLMVGIAGVLVGCLWLAFRRWSEVALSVAALALSFAVLLGVMRLLGAQWNLMNLVALPLLLGTSVDSTIHVQLAMRRAGGMWRAMWRTTGVALVLCAGANIAGFGSLAWSSNAGLASLDLVCAGGVVCVLGVSLGLLPGWWRWVHRGAEPTGTSGASQMYGAGGWRAACAVARWVPRQGLVAVAMAVAWAYGVVRPGRLATVAANLLPVVDGDSERARKLAALNLRNFAAKLVDLWRQEAGAMAGGEVETAGGWEAFHAAISSGRGVLLVTVHLGNWEAGSTVLTRFGVRPLVLTAPEPGGQLTGMRAQARARLGVDTLVVGADPFAFVGVIQRLQAGGVVALLVDRPPAGHGVEVEFLGRRILASPAAAELARATGAVILPVFVVRDGECYRAHALPIVEYERRALGSREDRVALTGRVLREFEPIVRRHPDQWFHFVPVWPEEGV